MAVNTRNTCQVKNPWLSVCMCTLGTWNTSVLRLTTLMLAFSITNSVVPCITHARHTMRQTTITVPCITSRHYVWLVYILATKYDKLDVCDIRQNLHMVPVHISGHPTGRYDPHVVCTCSIRTTTVPWLIWEHTLMHESIVATSSTQLRSVQSLSGNNPNSCQHRGTEL